jgi:hypothetical protein
MNYSRFVPIAVAAAVCLTASAAEAQHFRRGGGHIGGVVGHAVPRPFIGGGHTVVIAPRLTSPRIVGFFPYRPYYYPFRPGITVGFYTAYGYPYRFYGYPYAYRYPYPYAYPYLYGYGLPPAPYVSAVPGYAYGGVRIQGAPEEAQVLVDNYYVGIVDDFDGPFQHLNLTVGAHRIEIRAPGIPPVAFDVNVQPGQTITVHAGITR